MKSTSLLLATLVLTTLSISSCRKGSLWGIKGEGSDMTETRNMAGFSAIALSSDVDVTYTPDSVYSMEITGQRNILAVLDTRLEGRTLVVDYKRNVWRHNTVHLVIHAPALTKMTISGSGNIGVTNELKGDRLELTISGSGNVFIPLANLESLSGKISGSGNISINRGSCGTEQFILSGSGDISTEFFKAVDGTASISGSGDIRLNCSETLQATISGSGDVKYRGQATVTSNLSGSGRVIRLD